MYDRLKKDINLCHSVIAGKYVRMLIRNNVLLMSTAVVPMEIASSDQERTQKEMHINEENENSTSDFVLFI